MVFVHTVSMGGYAAVFPAGDWNISDRIWNSTDTGFEFFHALHISASTVVSFILS